MLCIIQIKIEEEEATKKMSRKLMETYDVNRVSFSFVQRLNIKSKKHVEYVTYEQFIFFIFYRNSFIIIRRRME